MNVTQSFAKRLKELRGKLSQGELAEKLGVSRGSISYYENGDRVADIEFLCKASNYFDVSVDYLLGKSDIEKPTIEEKAISKYTGLDEIAVCALKSINDKHPLYMKHLSILLGGDLCCLGIEPVLRTVDEILFEENDEYLKICKAVRTFVKENNLIVSDKDLYEREQFAIPEELRDNFEEFLLLRYGCIRSPYHQDETSYKSYRRFLLQNQILTLIDDTVFCAIAGEKAETEREDDKNRIAVEKAVKKRRGDLNNG